MYTSNISYTIYGVNPFMIRIPVIEYLYFGTCLRYLQDAPTGHRIKGTPSILDNIDRFLQTLGDIGLEVTLRISACRDLMDFREELDKTTPTGAELSVNQGDKLSRLMTDIRQTLEAELLVREAFVVTPKILDVSKLLNNVDALFAPDIFSELPEISQYDFAEAGKCIAFERPTAAAFHLLRGTEAVLRHFYCTFVRRKRVSHLMWGDMVKDLRERRKTKRYVTLYNNLDSIRLSYRNPTQHPDKVYDVQEVQDLWPLCVEVINRMTRILKAT